MNFNERDSFYIVRFLASTLRNECFLNIAPLGTHFHKLISKNTEKLTIYCQNNVIIVGDLISINFFTFFFDSNWYQTIGTVF